MVASPPTVGRSRTHRRPRCANKVSGFNLSSTPHLLDHLHVLLLVLHVQEVCRPAYVHHLRLWHEVHDGDLRWWQAQKVSVRVRALYQLLRHLLAPCVSSSWSLPRWWWTRRPGTWWSRRCRCSGRSTLLVRPARRVRYLRSLGRHWPYLRRRRPTSCLFLGTVDAHATFFFSKCSLPCGCQSRRGTWHSEKSNVVVSVTVVIKSNNW